MKKERVESTLDWYNTLIKNILDNIEFMRKTVQYGSVGIENEYNNVIGIEGERGFGKSTLLLNVCQQLKNNSDIVIEPITPAEFRISDSFYAIILIKLIAKVNEWRVLLADNQKLRYKVNDVYEELINLQLDQARSSWAFVENLKASGLRGDDFAWQFAESQNKKIFNKLNFSKVVTKILKLNRSILSSKKTKHKISNPLFIISVDDCDTSPELIPRFIDELENITKSQEIVVLVSYSADAMKRAISYKYLNPMKEILTNMIDANITSYETTQREISDLMYKLFPISHRTTLPGWGNVIDRLEYPSLSNSKDSIIKLFAKLRFNRKFPVKNIAEFFDLSNFIAADNKIIPSFYAEMLPKSGRDLNDLYDSLDILVHSRNNSKKLEEHEIGKVLKMICTAVASGFSINDCAEYKKRVKWNIKNQFQIDFSDLRIRDIGKYSKIIGRFTYDENNQIEFPVIKSFPSSLIIETLSSFKQKEVKTVKVRLMVDKHFKILKTDKEENRDWLSEELAYLLLFLMEWKENIFNVYNLTTGGNFSPTNPAFYSGISIELDGEERLFDFFLLPNYDKHLPNNIYFSIWNGWVEEIKSQHKKLDQMNLNDNLSHLDGNPYLCDLFALLHLDLLLSIQLNEKVIPVDINGILTSQEKNNKLFDLLKKRIISKIGHVLKNKKQHNNLTESTDIGDSLCNILMHLSTSIIFSHELISWIRNDIFEVFKDKLVQNEKDYEFLFNQYFEYCINTADLSYSKTMLSDFCKAMQTLSEKVFEKIYPIKFKKYVNAVRLFQPGIEAILSHLIAKKIIDSSDISILKEQGLTKNIQIKIELAVENSSYILNQLQELIPTDSEKLSIKNEDDLAEDD